MSLYTGLLLLVLGSCGPRTELPAQEEVTLLTSDGVRLAATYYPSPSTNASALILLPGRGETRSVWADFARRAQRNGYASLAIDLRGHGGSRRGSEGQLAFSEFETADWLAMGRDIAAAKEALIERGADLANIGAIGAGVSANVLLHYAHTDWDMQALVLLSPGLELEGVEIEPVMEAYGKRPVLMLYTTGDTYAASSVRQLHRVARGFTEIREYQGAAHGVDIIRKSNNAMNHVFLWLSKILVPDV